MNEDLNHGNVISSVAYRQRDLPALLHQPNNNGLLRGRHATTHH